MWPSRRWRWLTALLLGTGLAGLSGCKSSTAHTYPADPLLVSKKPIEGKAQTAPPVQSVAANVISPPSRAKLIAACSGRPSSEHAQVAILEPSPSRTRPSADDPREVAPLTQARASSAVSGQ